MAVTPVPPVEWLHLATFSESLAMALRRVGRHYGTAGSAGNKENGAILSQSCEYQFQSFLYFLMISFPLQWESKEVLHHSSLYIPTI